MARLHRVIVPSLAVALWISARCVAVAAAPTAAASQPVAVDRSTPAAGYRALFDAIERDDITAVTDSMINPEGVSNAESRLLAERLILGSKLSWAASEKWGRQGVGAVIRAADLPFLAKAAPGQITFETRDRPPMRDNPNITATSLGRLKNGPGVVVMSCINGQWKLDRSRGDPRLAIILKDAPAHNAAMRQVLTELSSGKISDQQALVAALLPHVDESRPSTNPAERLKPQDVPLALQTALENEDVDAIVECFTTPADPNGSLSPRATAEELVAKRKLDRALHERFGKEQGDRLASNCMLDTSHAFAGYANCKWTVEGDVARGVFPNGRFEPTMRMVRQHGKWQIEWPDTLFVRPPNAQVAESIKRRGLDHAQRTQIMKDILAHPEKYPDPGSILDQLGISSAETARQDPEQVKAEQERRRAELKAALDKEAQDLAASGAALPALERARREIALSLGRKMYLEADPQGVPGPDLFFVEGDPSGKYARARLHRTRATNALIEMADREIGSGAQRLAVQFGLRDALDDFMTFEELEWTVTGDRATAILPRQMREQGISLPALRKIGGDWKFDVTDEVEGNPSAAAARAEAEATAIERITADVKAMKLKTNDELANALRAANVRGTGKSM